MFTQLRRLPPPCRASRTRYIAGQRRNISFTTVAKAEDDEKPRRGRGSNDGPAKEEAVPYWEWIKRDDGGLPYREPNRPRNWLGGEVPFPMNRSFKPPAPVADSVRTAIYQQYMSDPKKNSVRVLAERYHLSIKRVDAILRLKGLEAYWVKSKPVQTGFVAGMEEILGVNEDKQHRRFGDRADPQRYDVTEADVLDAEEGNDPARLRYQRMFWEPVPEGQEPIMPTLLEHARLDAAEAAKEARNAKSDPKYVPRHQDTPTDKILYASKPGHATIKFVDVGGKFLDMRAQRRRIIESERRKRKKEAKRAT